MRSAVRILVPALCAVLTAGCASLHRRPGTGDIAFRLHWKGEEDLDLHVQEPSGATLFFLSRKSESGGELDVDCNSAADRICWTPIENVFWPVGRATEGDYTYWVEFFQHGQAQRPAPFALEVLLGKKVVHTETGTISAASPSSARFHFQYRRDPRPGR
ncbi:MAG TPA: hypothetical protein VGH73_01280 [Thermoanaerobaculia bacterium]